jgi:hypothetical protein
MRNMLMRDMVKEMGMGDGVGRHVDDKHDQVKHGDRGRRRGKEV